MADVGEGGTLKTFSIRVGQILATVIVTWFVADRAGLGLDEVRRANMELVQPDWPLLALSCIALASGYFVGGFLWGRIVFGLGARALPARESVRLFMIANLSRYIPGKFWQIAALATLARQRGVPAATATAAAVLLQGISLAAALLIGLGALWELAGEAAWRWAAPTGIAIGLVLGLVPPIFTRVTRLWFRVAHTKDPPELEPRHAIGWLAGGVVNWLIFVLAFWIFVRGLGFDMPVVPTASAFAAAYVIGYLAVFAPAGVGIREASLLAFLSPHVGPASAAAVAVLARLWTTGVEVLPAAAFWMRELARPLPARGSPVAGEPQEARRG